MSGVILGKGLDRDLKVYRIVPRKYFDDLFVNKKNVLVRPKLWGDPYENVALTSKISVGNEVVDFGFADDIYGQCWSLHTSSDAMWQVFSQGTDRTDGIRIRSTVGQLIDSLGASYPLPKMACFIGKVRYATDQELRSFAANHFKGGLDDQGHKIAETFLVKRNAFKHEREVRLIFNSPVGTLPNENLYRYDFDPYSMIDQIMLHPKIDKTEADTLKKVIKDYYGWNGHIKQSNLYRRTQKFVFPIGLGS